MPSPHTTPASAAATAGPDRTAGHLTFGPAMVSEMRRKASVMLGEPDINNLACGDDDAAFEQYEFARDNEVCGMAARKITTLYPSAENLRFSYEDDEDGPHLTAEFTLWRTEL